ncbi:MAG TPA: hypothetical protein VK192_09110 [Sphingomicrobium sp.]|jgi:hypothetical protein|nr:hypothetical protein [Sphingomicrobium sp.]
MIRSASLTTLLVTPPLTGPFAPILSAAALAVPTAFLSLDHALPAGACCTTYFPFVLLTAVLSGPTYASMVAIGSAGLADALFMGPRYQLFESAMDKFGDAASLFSFALIIAVVSLFRGVVSQRLPRSRRSIEAPSGIIFSLEKGVALASWPGASARVPLGSEQEVAEMMQDFLAQLELGKRLTQRPKMDAHFTLLNAAAEE